MRSGSKKNGKTYAQIHAQKPMESNGKSQQYAGKQALKELQIALGGWLTCKKNRADGQPDKHSLNWFVNSLDQELVTRLKSLSGINLHELIKPTDETIIQLLNVYRKDHDGLIGLALLKIPGLAELG